MATNIVPVENSSVGASGVTVVPARNVPYEIFTRLCKTFPKTPLYELKVKQLIKEYFPVVNQLVPDAVVAIIKELRTLIQRDEWPHVVNMFKGVFILLAKERNPHLMLKTVRDLLTRFPDMASLHETEQVLLLEYRNMVVAAKKLFDVKGKKAEFFDLVGRMFGEVHSLHLAPTAAVLRRMLIFERETGIQCRPKKPDDFGKLSKFEERLLEAKKRRREEEEINKLAKQNRLNVQSRPPTYSQPYRMHTPTNTATPDLFPLATPQQEAAEGNALLNQAISHVMQGCLPLTIANAPLHANNGAHEVNSALLMAVTYLTRAYSGRNHCSAPRQEAVAPPVDPFYQVRLQSQSRAQPGLEPNAQDQQDGRPAHAQAVDRYNIVRGVQGVKPLTQTTSPQGTAAPPVIDRTQAQADTVRFLHSSAESMLAPHNQNHTASSRAAQSTSTSRTPFAAQPHVLQGEESHDPWASLREYYGDPHVYSQAYSSQLSTQGGYYHGGEYEYHGRAPAVEHDDHPLAYQQPSHTPQQHAGYEQSPFYPQYNYPDRSQARTEAQASAVPPQRETPARARAEQKAVVAVGSSNSTPSAQTESETDSKPPAATAQFDPHFRPQSNETLPQPQHHEAHRPAAYLGSDGEDSAHRQLQNNQPQHHHNQWGAAVAGLQRGMYEPPAPARPVHDPMQRYKPYRDYSGNAYGGGGEYGRSNDPYAQHERRQHASRPGANPGQPGQHGQHGYSPPGNPLSAHSHGQFGAHPAHAPPHAGLFQMQQGFQGQAQAPGQSSQSSQSSQASPQVHPALASVTYGAQDDPFEGYASSYGYSRPSDRSVPPGMGAYSAQFRAQNAHNYYPMQHDDGYHLRTGPDASAHTEHFGQYSYGGVQHF